MIYFLFLYAVQRFCRVCMPLDRLYYLRKSTPERMVALMIYFLFLYALRFCRVYMPLDRQYYLRNSTPERMVAR